MHLLTFFSIGGVMLPIRLISVSSAWKIYLHVKFTLSLKIAIYFSKEGWGGLIKFGRTYWGIGYLVRGGWFWRGRRVDHYLELLPPNLLVLQFNLIFWKTVERIAIIKYTLHAYSMWRKPPPCLCRQSQTSLLQPRGPPAPEGSA